jgi:hypothetical protein
MKNAVLEEALCEYPWKDSRSDLGRLCPARLSRCRSTLPPPPSLWDYTPLSPAFIMSFILFVKDARNAAGRSKKE